MLLNRVQLQLFKRRIDRIYNVRHLHSQSHRLTHVLIFANLAHTNYTIEYFNERVLKEIEKWPDGILADYARLVELLMEFGPNLKMPHSKALGKGLFELRPKGKEGIGRTFYCYLVGQRIIILHAFIKKTQEAPENEMKVARKRVKEVQNG